MKDFNCLVSEQLKIMDKLLFVQSELERCQDIEQQLKNLQEESKLGEVQSEIIRMRKELKEIHQVFEQQTEEVIRSYQEKNVNC